MHKLFSYLVEQCLRFYDTRTGDKDWFHVNDSSTLLTYKSSYIASNRQIFGQFCSTKKRAGFKVSLSECIDG